MLIHIPQHLHSLGFVVVAVSVVGVSVVIFVVGGDVVVAMGVAASVWNYRHGKWTVISR